MPQARGAGWDPVQYGQFADHRLQPAVDLIRRIPRNDFQRIVDLGCGGGNVTDILKTRWPDAIVTGVDSSSAMLEEARARGRAIDWQIGDIASWRPGGEDLIFSNAALHWIDDHEGLLSRLVGGLPDGGVLAFQVPDNFDQPSHRIMRDVAADPRWCDRLAAIAGRRPVEPLEVYLEWLKRDARDVEAWRTTYDQSLTGPDPVFEWLKGAAMRPYLALLADAEFADFQEQCRERLSAAYPADAGGATAFPFRRLFVIAVR